MFRELKVKPGNERLGKLQNLRTILVIGPIRGIKSPNVKRFEAKMK